LASSVFVAAAHHEPARPVAVTIRDAVRIHLPAADAAHGHALPFLENAFVVAKLFADPEDLGRVSERFHEFLEPRRRVLSPS
jgi:hypothetical protein